MRGAWKAVTRDDYLKAFAALCEEGGAGGTRLTKYWIEIGEAKLPAKAVARAAFTRVHGRPPGNFSSHKGWAKDLKVLGVPIRWADEPQSDDAIGQVASPGK